MSEVFADTVYFIAHFNRADQYHRKALELSDRLGGLLVTTDWVLIEVADGFAKTRYRSRVRPLVSRLRHSSISEIVPVSSALLEEALDLYHERADKEWTLTDCTSFLVMKERGITEALTGDRHFEQAGFKALLK
jgi:predicted nucleic acid-binding protein